MMRVVPMAPVPVPAVLAGVLTPDGIDAAYVDAAAVCVAPRVSPRPAPFARHLPLLFSLFLYLFSTEEGPEERAAPE